VAAQKLAEALKLAEQLGGTSVVLNGDDLVGAVLDYARRNNVTQIVVGKSHRKGWRAWFHRSLAPELLKAQNGAALHVITEVTTGSGAASDFRHAADGERLARPSRRDRHGRSRRSASPS
jgi:K+-sensing histidine kinase KdpD